MLKVITVVIAQAFNLCSYLKEQSACLLKGNDMVIFSKQPTSLRIVLELITGNVIISQVDACMYVVLSMAEKLVPYGELVGVTESVMLQMRCSQTEVVITEFSWNVESNRHLPISFHKLMNTSNENMK